MAITEVSVPKQYVLIQKTEPTGAFAGQLWYKPDTANTYIYQADEWKLITIDPSGEFSFIENEIATHELNIIELRAITESTPIDAETLLSDTFNISTGLKQSFESATALFQTNKYARIPNELGKNLIAYYNFDETSGDLIDQVGSNDGTNTSVTQNQTGIIDKAYSYNGTSSYTSLANESNFDGLTSITSSFTINAWIKLDTVTGEKTILGKTQNGSIGEFNISNDKIYWINAKSLNNYTAYMGDTILSADTWYFVTVTQDTGTIKLFVNGVEQNLTTSVVGSGRGTTNNSETAKLGSRNKINQFFDGLIDEVGFWDRALTEEEIGLIYNVGAGRKYSTENYADEKQDETQEIILNLPTISGEVTHTQLIINGEIETGASVTYKLNNDTTDSAETEINTKNAYTLTGNPTKLKVYLNPKEEDATEGNPNVKTYCLKIWKSGGE